MKVTTRIKLFVLNLVCRVVGHRKQRASVGSIGALYCARCYRVTDQLTVRRGETKGDADRIMERIAKMTSYTFNYINWKKRIAHFTQPSGKPYTVPVGAASKA
jgi:Prophage protein (DUF1660)